MLSILIANVVILLWEWFSSDLVVWGTFRSMDVVVGTSDPCKSQTPSVETTLACCLLAGRQGWKGVQLACSVQWSIIWCWPYVILFLLVQMTLLIFSLSPNQLPSSHPSLPLINCVLDCALNAEINYNLEFYDSAKKALVRNSQEAKRGTITVMVICYLFNFGMALQITRNAYLAVRASCRHDAYQPDKELKHTLASVSGKMSVSSMGKGTLALEAGASRVGMGRDCAISPSQYKIVSWLSCQIKKAHKRGMDMQKWAWPLCRWTAAPPLSVYQ